MGACIGKRETFLGTKCFTNPIFKFALSALALNTAAGGVVEFSPLLHRNRRARYGVDDRDVEGPIGGFRRDASG